MSTVNPTDKVLVNRAGIDHSTPADMSTVQDTDLLLINRAGVDYKCTFADWKKTAAPSIAVPSSLVVADVAGGARFAGVNFPVTLTLSSEATPVSTKALKASVSGTIVQKVTPSATVLSVGTNTVTVDPVKAADFRVGDKIYLDAIASDWTAGWTITGNTDERAANQASVGLTLSLDGNVIFTDNKVGTNTDSVLMTRPTPVHINGLLVKWRLYDGDPGYPTLSLEYQSVAGGPWTKVSLTKIGTEPPGVTDRSAINVYALSLGVDVIGIRNIVGGYPNGAVFYLSPGARYATVKSVVAGVITYEYPTATFLPAPGNPVAQTTGMSTSTTTLYCKLAAGTAGALDVTDLLSADPGFATWTPAGTGPYTGTINFPTTLLGSGLDTTLAAGVVLNVSGQVTSGAINLPCTAAPITPV